MYVLFSYRYDHNQIESWWALIRLLWNRWLFSKTVQLPTNLQNNIKELQTMQAKYLQAKKCFCRQALVGRHRKKYKKYEIEV